MKNLVEVIYTDSQTQERKDGWLFQITDTDNHQPVAWVINMQTRKLETPHVTSIVAMIQE